VALHFDLKRSFTFSRKGKKKKIRKENLNLSHKHSQNQFVVIMFRFSRKNGNIAVHLLSMIESFFYCKIKNCGTER